MIVGLYLVAIVVANLVAAWLGPVATVVNAFVFIGFDMTFRDVLHEKWDGRGLWWKMGALIAAGGLLSWGMNPVAGRIGLASVIAFVISGLTDAGSYHLLKGRSRFMRMNGSNMVASMMDSLLFPTIAFGVLMPEIIIGQWMAKVLGGLMWTVVLKKLRWA